MGTLLHFTHRMAIAASGTLVLGLGLAACSSNPPPRTVANVPAPAPAMPVAIETPPPAAAAPRVTQVHIDDAILKACGMTADQAFFAFDSAKLLDKDVEPLDQLARCFTMGPLSGRSMKLIGRADPRGEDEYNMVLGQSRADQVSAFLIKMGMPRTQINTTSRGAMDAMGNDEVTWAYDRRVDVLLGS